MALIDLRLGDRKWIRAKEIARWMEEAGYDQAICFSCGNASKELKNAGIKTLEIAPGRDLQAQRWFKQSEIRRFWPHCFDATSGNLPAELMERIGWRLATLAKFELKERGFIDRDRDVLIREDTYRITCGSGETLVALAMAKPGFKFEAVYDNENPATRFEKEAPLTPLVFNIAERVWLGDKLLKACDASFYWVEG